MGFVCMNVCMCLFLVCILVYVSSHYHFFIMYSICWLTCTLSCVFSMEDYAGMYIHTSLYTLYALPVSVHVCSMCLLCPQILWRNNSIYCDN